MRNPLNKRLPREFIGEFGKYAVIFLFMTVTIGFVSGFLVAGGSMIKAYEESFEKYNIEDGHFVLAEEAGEELVARLEKEDVTIYRDYYVEEETDRDFDGEAESTLRIYQVRDEVNQVCLMKGELPKDADEIAIDRMYADNNEIAVGDYIQAAEKKLLVTGYVALSDYSALFSDNSDMMFDSVKFGVGVMTEEGFHAFGDKHLHYCYSWKYDEEPEDEIAEKQQSEDFMEVLAGQAVINAFVPRYLNQAIQFTGDDMGGDRVMMLMLLYILIVILAFVFSVTINHTVAREASVIGTLRASGYTRGELIRHYLAIPLVVTFLAAILGNILGYTLFKDIVVSMYYGSYSLPTYETIWNEEAFVLTTVIPMLIMILTNVLSLIYRLSLSPLQFLRRDLSRNKKKKAVRLPDFRFIQRFRLRIILQNRSSYLTLFVGILFANLILLFGMMMSPLLSHFQEEVVTNMLCDYQYILKTPVEAEEEDAEQYCVTSLKMIQDGYSEESVSVYGITEESRYIDCRLSGEQAFVSDGLAEKYRLKVGDTITAREAYGETEYEFQVAGIYDYPASLTIFISDDYFREVFEKEDDYFNGYFSNTELTEIDERYISSCITEEDLTKVSRQLEVSMGKMFYMVNIFAVVLSALLIYLLTKLILEKNTNAISMVKILGYKNSEIAGLYLVATTWVVIVSVLLGFVIDTWVIDLIYTEMMKGFSGWLTFYISPKIYGEMFFMTVAAYVVVALLQFGKIKRIPMEEALKNVE